MKVATLLFLTLAWVGMAQAGEIVKRPLGVDEQGQVIEGYVFQSNSSSCNRRSSSRSRGYGYGYAYPYSYGYGSRIYVPTGSSAYQSLPIVRVQGQRPVYVVPARAPVVKPVPVAPVRATIIIR